MPSNLKRLTVYLPDDVYYDLLKYCKSGRMFKKKSMSAIAVMLLSQYVEELRKRDSI